MDTPVVGAEVEPTAMIATIGLASAYVRETSINLLAATRVVAGRGHPVADISVPIRVVANRPAHQDRSSDTVGGEHRSGRLDLHQRYAPQCRGPFLMARNG